MHIFKAVSELHVDGAGPPWVGWPPGGGAYLLPSPKPGSTSARVQSHRAAL